MASNNATSPHPSPRAWQLNQRLLLTCLLLVGLALVFWLGSRYPALNEKALMGGDTQLSGIGFDTVMEVSAEDSVVTQILSTTANWAYTNKQGMTFGILFASVLMTLLASIRTRSFQNRFANSALGLMIGSPLGVCVNCAAPIAKGIHAGGARIETMLAAMMSSPTMNVIVLTMLFSLFPFYMAALKVALTLGFILVGIPLLMRLFPSLEQARLNEETAQKLATKQSFPDQANCGIPSAETWFKSLSWVTHAFAKNLLYIIKLTVPLMLLAGLLGATFITLFPLDSLADFLPQSGGAVTLFGMAILALVGVFLPIPMAFDVIVCSILLQAGVPPKYVMVLLFTLAIFSIYPFFIVWQSISQGVAVSLFLVLSGLGVVAGASAHYAHQWHMDQQRNLFINTFQSSDSSPAQQFFDWQSPTAASEPFEPSEVQHQVGEQILRQADISVRQIAFSTKSNGQSDTVFMRIPGHEFGLRQSEHFSVLKMTSPWSFHRGVASGDIHNDGWADLVLMADQNLMLYANQQGQGFVPQAINIPELNSFYIMNAALVDINDDGWLDLYFSTYRKGNYVIYNKTGKFSEGDLHKLPNHDSAFATVATAFGDIDSDGDLDLVLGNWSTMFNNKWTIDASRNVLLINDNGIFQQHPLAGTPGETLSLLFSDINGDTNLDLLVGNDYRVSDMFYLGDGQGGFELIKNSDGIVPSVPFNTMSIDSADLNNDLTPEILHIQISANTAVSEIVPPQQLCAGFADQETQAKCESIMAVRDQLIASTNTRDALTCQSMEAQGYQADCVALHLLQMADREQDPKYCKYFSSGWEEFAFICAQMFGPAVIPDPDAKADAIPQGMNAQNTLLMRDANGRFVDRAKELGLNHSGWSWNSKFADLDNDGWQDVYVVNGIFNVRTRSSDYLFQNQQGQYFKDKTDQFGLSSLWDTSAYTYTDLDNDGDLDIVSVPAVGPPSVFRNNSQAGNAIVVELRDHTGNHFGIGSKITIQYGNGEQQMREIKASGGFLSFDAPIAHFGLAGHQSIDSLEIHWSSGEVTRLDVALTAGARYVVTRNP